MNGLASDPRAGGLGLSKGPARHWRGYVRGEAAAPPRSPTGPLPTLTEPTGPPFTGAKWLDGRATADWLRGVGVYGRVVGWQTSSDRHRRSLSDRLTRWNAGGGRASERALDRLLLELGLSLRDVPSHLYLMNGTARSNGGPAKKERAATSRPSTRRNHPTPGGADTLAGERSPSMRLIDNPIPLSGSKPRTCRCAPRRNLIEGGVCVQCGQERGTATKAWLNGARDVRSKQMVSRAPIRRKPRLTDGTRKPVTVLGRAA